MLCNKQSEIGMIGASFFIGIMISMCWAPKFSDKYGRYPLTLMTFSAQLLSLIGLYFSHTIEMTAFFMVFLGMSHPGKNIIFFNYLLEMIPTLYKQNFITIIVTVENAVIIFVCLAYQFVDHSWRLTEEVALAITAVTLLFNIFYHEESA